MKIRILLVLLFVFLVFSVSAEEEIASGELDLKLDLGEGVYIFGLSSNPITSATPTPNDVSPQLMVVETDGGLIGAIGERSQAVFVWRLSRRTFDIPPDRNFGCR